MNSDWEIAATPDTLAAKLQGMDYVGVEFMHKPRPEPEPERRAFDFALASRLRALGQHANTAALFLCRDADTLDSLAHVPAAFPTLRLMAAFINPNALPDGASDPNAHTPWVCAWPEPDRWRPYPHTDRWARILFALETAQRLNAPGYLILAAQDAVWGAGLIARLTRHSLDHSRNELPAAVSPYARVQHSPVPGVEISPLIIDALNAAFTRAAADMQQQMTSGHFQGFWGKTGMIPFGMCGMIRATVEVRIWEDDLEIDRAIRDAGWAASALWVEDPAVYRQAPPVFDRAGLKAVIARTLHYSLPIPGPSLGAHSLLTRPLDAQARALRDTNSAYARALALAEALTAECMDEAATRIAHCGLSWVDWGDYRHVVRVGDPFVQVWKYERHRL
jgi:hypothetical protein